MGSHFFPHARPKVVVDLSPENGLCVTHPKDYVANIATKSATGSHSVTRSTGLNIGAPSVLSILQ